MHTDSEELQCLVRRGDFLGSERMVHIPGMPIPAGLTDDDEGRIRKAIQNKIDVILIPGVRDAAYVYRVKEFVREYNKYSLYCMIVET